MRLNILLLKIPAWPAAGMDNAADMADGDVAAAVLPHIAAAAVVVLHPAAVE